MKKALKVILPLIIVIASFGGGFLAGKSPRFHHRGGPVGEFSERPVNRMKARLTRKLELTEQQQVSLKQILEEKRAQLKELKKEYRPLLREHRKSLNRSVMAILEPEQKKKYQQILRKHKERREERRAASARRRKG